MIRIVVYVAIVTALVFLAVWFAETPGQVSLQWHGWRVDTSVAVLFVIMAVLLAVGAFLIRVWSTLIGAGRTLQQNRRDKRINRGLDALAKGYAAVRGGDSGAAKKAAQDARSALGDVSTVQFLEQQASRIGGDRSGSSAQARTLLENPALKPAVLRDLADIALETGDRNGALRHAVRALEHKPPPQWACGIALEQQIALGLWEDAVATVERKDLQALFGAVNVGALKGAVYGRAAAGALDKQDAPQAVAWSRKALAANPHQPDAAATLGLALIAEGKVKKAGAELEKAWAANPHPAILSAFMQMIPGEAPLARASRIEKLVQGNPDHPESRLAVAEAALVAELWGQARGRLEPLLRQTDIPMQVKTRAATLMAQVELAEHGDSKAATKALISAIEARSTVPAKRVPTTVTELLEESA